MMQKTFISDCISKKVTRNTGQLPMYLIQNHHDAIVSRDTFNAAQTELARRKASRSPSQKSSTTGQACYSAKYALTERLVCGECGKTIADAYGRNKAKNMQFGVAPAVLIMERNIATTSLQFTKSLYSRRF